MVPFVPVIIFGPLIVSLNQLIWVDTKAYTLGELGLPHANPHEVMPYKIGTSLNQYFATK